MQHRLAGYALIGAMALAGCQSLSPQDQSNLGLIGGTASGVLLARAFDANDNWTILAGLAGATVGTLVARNAQSGQCAYSRGDGTYDVRPC